MKEIIYYKTYDNKCPYLEYLKKGMNKMDIEKIKSENITHEQHMNNVLQDIEYQKMYLDAAIQEFITEGDYDLFFSVFRTSC